MSPDGQACTPNSVRSALPVLPEDQAGGKPDAHDLPGKPGGGHAAGHKSAAPRTLQESSCDDDASRSLHGGSLLAFSEAEPGNSGDTGQVTCEQLPEQLPVQPQHQLCKPFLGSTALSPQSLDSVQAYPPAALSAAESIFACACASHSSRLC